MIIELLPPSYSHECTSVSYGGWPGFELYITDPNGTKTSLGPYTSDVSGTYQVEYTPDTVGTYSFYFNFPGEENNNGYIAVHLVTETTLLISWLAPAKQ